VTSSCPDIIGVGLASAAGNCLANGIEEEGRGGGCIASSLRSIDLTPTTLIPAAEARISAFALASYMACFMTLVLVSSNFLSDNAKSTLFTVFAPAAIAVSIHFDVLFMFVLCICIVLDTVNSIILLDAAEDDCCCE
jgi:hypothetical protein